MIPAVESRRSELAELCAKRRVRRLAVFGSAAAGDFDPRTSDVDILVEFEPMPPAEHAESYFGLMEEMQRLLGLPVDLVESAAVRNPYFRREVERTQVALYEAA
ncbi:MAG: nucleotidyltransferase family protein [Planctomycetota bacterium]|jgi:predicted nucleotidyltransferase